MTTTAPKTNKSAAECANCGTHLEPGMGRLAGKSGRTWTIVCLADCGSTAAMPKLRRPNTRDRGGMNAVRGVAARREAKSYVGMTWAEVLEANEHFDGEPEITDAAHRRWVSENAEAQMAADPAMRKYIPFIDRTTNWGDADEAIMHAMEAYADRYEGEPF